MSHTVLSFPQTRIIRSSPQMPKPITSHPQTRAGKTLHLTPLQKAFLHAEELRTQNSITSRLPPTLRSTPPPTGFPSPLRPSIRIEVQRGLDFILIDLRREGQLIEELYD